MNTLDIVILVILIIGGLNGLRQGLVTAFANLVGWIFALIVGTKYATILAPSMASLSQDPVVQKIAAFAFIVLLIVVLTWMVTAFLNKLLKTLRLGPLNRLAGSAFGSLKGLLIVLITMQGMQPWVESSPYWKQSKFVYLLLPYAPWASKLSKDVATDALSHIQSDNAPKISHSSSDKTPKSTARTDESTNNPFY